MKLSLVGRRWFVWLAFALLTALVSLTCASTTLANSAPGPQALPLSLAASVTLNPVADAYVDQSYPSTNYGSAAELRADRTPVQYGLLRFNVSGLSGSVSQAILRVYTNNALAAGFNLYRVANNTWGETTLTSSNAPTPGALIGSATNCAVSAWASVDVTAYVTGNGTFSFALINLTNDALSVSSREGSNAPQLIITTNAAATATPTRTATTAATATRTATTAATATRTATTAPTATRTATTAATATRTATTAPTATRTPTIVPAATATRTPTIVPAATATRTATTAATSPANAVTLSPVADAYVDQTYPSTNYGTAAELRADRSPVQYGLLRFNVSGLSGSVSQAILRVHTNNALAAGFNLYRVATNTWGETTLTSSNAPAPGTLIGSATNCAVSAWASVDVTAYVTGNGTFSFALVNLTNDALSMSSREGPNAPQLVITTNTTVPATVTPTRTATGTVPTATRTATATTVPATATIVAPTATPTSTSGGLQVTSIAANASSVGRYQKFELTFQISRAFAADSLLPYYFYDAADTAAADPGRKSPYGVDGISIDAHMRAPSGTELVVPAFYYQEYSRSGSSTEVMTPSSTFAWKVRFTPEEVGAYTYYLTLQDKSGTGRYPASGTLSLNVAASSAKGFVRTAAADPRFLAYTTGQSFIPVASGRQWWKCCGARSLDYETALNAFGTNGINLTRIWDQDDGYALTVEGHFDAYAYPGDYNPIDRGVDIGTLPKGTQMNQRGNYEEDKIIEAAERNGVLIDLASHGDPYWIWDASVLTESWNPSPVAPDDWRHLNYWKRNFRYRVARWGYSPAILAWETWNEHGHITPGSTWYNFYQQYGAYQKATDPYRHLRTTSLSSQAYSPGLWSSGAMDMATYHDYMMISRYPAALTNDEANFVYRFAWCLGTQGSYCSGLGVGDGSTWAGTAKPWLFGEFDAGTTVWNEVNPTAKSGEGRLRMLHTSTWAGLFSPLGTSPIDWYWDQEDAATTTARLADRKVTQQFFNTIDYANARWTYLMSASDVPVGYTGTTLAVSQAKLRVYGMRRSDNTAAYLWVQHRDHTWYNASSTPAAVSGTVTMTGLVSGRSYAVSVWNTYTGAQISSTAMTATGGNLTINVSNVSTDVAIRIE